MNGYMKLHLASHTDTPILRYAGDWAKSAKRVKLMAKPRKYKLTFHLYDTQGRKAVETYTCQQAVAPDELSSVIYELGVQMADTYPDVQIDFFNQLCGGASMKLILDAHLPLPPSVNDYWRRSKFGMYLSAKAKAYKQQVKAILQHAEPSDKRLWVNIIVHYADRRKNDIDNRLKSLLDALTYAGVYVDDGQIDMLSVKRGQIIKGGRIDVKVWELS